MGERFWRWLSAYSMTKAREAYMAKAFHDRRCPNCLRWTSETAGALAHREVGPERDAMTCRGCGAESEWLVLGPVAIPAPRPVHGRDGE
jgi:hypothetical protein